MNIAILSVTNQGKKISDILFENLKDNPLILNVSQYHKNIIATVNDIFDKYDCIIGIMASGIMIRSIAPHVNSKLSDPAVLLIDDNANFVISLLSGHFGGANDLTLKIANILGSKPVITTSTDVNNKTGIDSIAKRYYCSLENPKNIKFINPLASPCAGAPALKYGYVNTVTPAPGEVKGLMKDFSNIKSLLFLISFSFNFSFFDKKFFI